ncbi:unnamed protein product [Cochlearia groenlandica]
MMNSRSLPSPFGEDVPNSATVTTSEIRVRAARDSSGGSQTDPRAKRDKPYEFEFVYEDDGPFLNNSETCAGLEHMLYESHEEKFPPNSLVFEDEIAALACLEQSVSYSRGRTFRTTTCVFLLSNVGRLSWPNLVFGAAEKERDEARDEVEEISKNLRLAKREKTVKKLREQLAKFDRNVNLVVLLVRHLNETSC